MNDHEIGELVNSLRDCAIGYHHTQQLRERLHCIIVPKIDQLRTELEQANKRIAELENPWISVETALPKLHTPVWATNGEDILLLDRYEDTDGWLWAQIYAAPRFDGVNWFYDAECDDDYSWVTHWKYLPSPPKESDKRSVRK